MNKVQKLLLVGSVLVAATAVPVVLVAQSSVDHRSRFEDITDSASAFGSEAEGFARYTYRKVTNNDGNRSEDRYGRQYRGTQRADGYSQLDTDNRDVFAWADRSLDSLARLFTHLDRRADNFARVLADEWRWTQRSASAARNHSDIDFDDVSRSASQQWHTARDSAAAVLSKLTRILTPASEHTAPDSNNGRY